jgi:hypothetical protein
MIKEQRMTKTESTTSKYYCSKCKREHMLPSNIYRAHFWLKEKTFKIGDDVLCEDGQSGKIVEVSVNDTHPYKVGNYWYKAKHLQLIPHAPQPNKCKGCGKIIEAGMVYCDSCYFMDGESLGKLIRARELQPKPTCPNCGHPIEEHGVDGCLFVHEYSEGQPISGCECTRTPADLQPEPTCPEPNVLMICDGFDPEVCFDCERYVIHSNCKHEYRVCQTVLHLVSCRPVDADLQPEYDWHCKFGNGKQDFRTCPMLYIHIKGYYPTEELFQYALKTLCPNMQPEPTCPECNGNGYADTDGEIPCDNCGAGRIRKTPAEPIKPKIIPDDVNNLPCDHDIDCQCGYCQPISTTSDRNIKHKVTGSHMTIQKGKPQPEHCNRCGGTGKANPTTPDLAKECPECGHPIMTHNKYGCQARYPVCLCSKTRSDLVHESDLEYKEERESHSKPVKIEINSKVPSKWRFVDLETGDIWKWDEGNNTFMRATLK